MFLKGLLNTYLFRALEDDHSRLISQHNWGDMYDC